MRIKSLVVRSMIILVIFTVGILVGTFSFRFATANTYLNESFSPGPDYPKNEAGQTYGSGLYATSPDTEPDLIKAYGVDGTHGYVLAVDLHGEMPKTPEEALDQQSKRAGRVREIPLYDVDGKTVIGVFNVDAPQGIKYSTEANE